MVDRINKYLLIGHRFGSLKRGGYTVTVRFCNEHPDNCEFLEDTRIRKLEKLKYKKLIFLTQVPHCYNPNINFIKLLNVNHIFYLRAEHVNSLYNSCTNGFYYYKENLKIKNYIPTITNFPKTKEPKEECVGFYVRRWLTPDSFDFFMDMLDNYPKKLKVCIMGDPCPEIENHNNVLHYNHTYDNVQFFSEITHYVYPASKIFQDPFPHSILEAVQSGKEIIIPDIQGRNHRDGIDDIKDCIKWHKKLNIDKIGTDNKNQILIAKNFRKFYRKVFDNDFEYEFDRKKYETMKEWIEGEVL